MHKKADIYTLITFTNWDEKNPLTSISTLFILTLYI